MGTIRDGCSASFQDSHLAVGTQTHAGSTAVGAVTASVQTSLTSWLPGMWHQELLTQAVCPRPSETGHPDVFCLRLPSLFGAGCPG